MSNNKSSGPGNETILPTAEIKITQEMINTYAEISGDFNPLHVDIAAAAETPFGGTIAHGCIPMEPIFQSLHRWLGKPSLPPETAMRLRYYQPSRPGDVIHVEARLSEQPTNSENGLKVIFACLNQRGEKVLEGECEIPDGNGDLDAR